MTTPKLGSVKVQARFLNEETEDKPLVGLYFTQANKVQNIYGNKEVNLKDLNLRLSSIGALFKAQIEEYERKNKYESLDQLV